MLISIKSTPISFRSNKDSSLNLLKIITVLSLIIAHVRLLFQNLRFQVSLIIAHVRLLETNENYVKCMIYSINPLC